MEEQAITNCNGCQKACPLTEPDCGRGRAMAEAVANGTYNGESMEGGWERHGRPHDSHGEKHERREGGRGRGGKGHHRHGGMADI